MNENKRKPVVREKLFCLAVGNLARNNKNDIRPVIVTSVGHKYFKCQEEGKDRSFEIQYHIDTWLEKADGCVDHKLYESMQEWLDETEKGKLDSKFCESFKYYRSNFTIEQLRAVDKILFPKAPTEGAECTNPA